MFQAILARITYFHHLNCRYHRLMFLISTCTCRVQRVSVLKLHTSMEASMCGWMYSLNSSSKDHGVVVLAWNCCRSLQGMSLSDARTWELHLQSTLERMHSTNGQDTSLCMTPETRRVMHSEVSWLTCSSDVHYSWRLHWVLPKIS